MNLCAKWLTISKFGVGIAIVGSLLLVSDASASVINTLLTGSTGNVTASLRWRVRGNFWSYARGDHNHLCQESAVR